MHVSKSRSLLMMVKPEVFHCAIALGILVHLGFLLFNAILVRSLSVGPWGGNSVFGKKENSRALMLVCSQRSLLIATTVVEQLGGVLGESGLLVLPCVAAHVNQIIVDSLLVNFWIQKDEPRGIVEKP
ncbi:putative sodium/metabolite cotransporter BASS4, chloroplastic [Silene latifolia]|uniref:putative sodium/metabolite cotransporter BASS4, chloroplastic n=1 Tax=Silene latifolia TaxID=37657 RepID=UPI003D772F8F